MIIHCTSRSFFIIIYDILFLRNFFTYIDFIMLINISHRSFELYDGDRIAQLEFHEDSHMTLEEMDTPPQKKTSRQGGFGHTGV